MSKSADQNHSLAALYEELAPQLERIVSSNVRAPSTTIEEACQAAWVWLIADRDQIAVGTEIRWLAITATREALRLARLGRRDLSLEREQEEEGELCELVFEPGPERAVEFQERLAEVRKLPARQSRMVMLQGFGYRYAEIAEITGDSRRTVDRQLSRARQRLTG